MTKLLLLFLVVLLTGCNLDEPSSGVITFDKEKPWYPDPLPEGCTVKQIAAGRYYTHVLCEDGRLFISGMGRG
jgi:hypothetical protein